MAREEPTVVWATVRDGLDAGGFPVLDIECRFTDGQKYAAIQVDAALPGLAQAIATWLTAQAILP